MKRTEKKLKSKGIKGHGFTHCLCEKYYRNYLVKSGAGFTHLPFSRCAPSEFDEKWNRRLRQYLNRWFDKQVGKSIDDVFHNFKMLGWKSSHDMYYYWDSYVHANDISWDYHVDENGCLISGYWNRNQLKPKKFGNVQNEANGKPKAKRRNASDKRLTRKHLEYNASVKVPDMGVRNSSYPDARLMGEFYVEYKHKVVKCPVYHIKYPLNPKYMTFSSFDDWLDYNQSKSFCCDFVRVKIVGPYREERVFIQHHWKTKVVTQYNAKEQMLDAVVTQYDAGCGKLLPCIRKSDAKR